MLIYLQRTERVPTSPLRPVYNHGWCPQTMLEKMQPVFKSNVRQAANGWFNGTSSLTIQVKKHINAFYASWYEWKDMHFSSLSCTWLQRVHVAALSGHTRRRLRRMSSETELEIGPLTSLLCQTKKTDLRLGLAPPCVDRYWQPLGIIRIYVLNIDSFGELPPIFYCNLIWQIDSKLYDRLWLYHI